MVLFPDTLKGNVCIYKNYIPIYKFILTVKFTFMQLLI